jgi:hypothetical protein
VRRRTRDLAVLAAREVPRPSRPAPREHDEVAALRDAIWRRAGVDLGERAAALREAWASARDDVRAADPATRARARRDIFAIEGVFVRDQARGGAGRVEVEVVLAPWLDTRESREPRRIGPQPASHPAPAQE